MDERALRSLLDLQPEEELRHIQRRQPPQQMLDQANCSGHVRPSSQVHQGLAAEVLHE